MVPRSSNRTCRIPSRSCVTVKRLGMQAAASEVGEILGANHQSLMGCRNTKLPGKYQFTNTSNAAVQICFGIAYHHKPFGGTEGQNKGRLFHQRNFQQLLDNLCFSKSTDPEIWFGLVGKGCNALSIESTKSKNGSSQQCIIKASTLSPLGLRLML